MKARAKDLVMAERLFDQDRYQDAVKLIDRLLEFTPEMTSEQRAATVRAAFDHVPEVDMAKIMKTSTREDGATEVDVSLEQIPLGGAFVPTFVLLRAKCLTGVLQETKTQEAALAAGDSSDMIWELFPGDGDLLACAAQPLVMMGMREHAERFFSRALACERTQYVTSMIDYVERQGMVGKISPEPGYVPQGRRLLKTSEITADASIGRGPSRLLPIGAAPPPSPVAVVSAAMAASAPPPARSGPSTKLILWVGGALLIFAALMLLVR